MIPSVVFTLCCLAGLLISEYRELRWGVWLFKPAASCGFIATALAVGALGAGSYGGLLLAGLVLCWWGDVFLIPREHPAVFRAGILSFLLGHVAYSIAFVDRGLDWPTAVGALVALSIPATVVMRWLRPHVPPNLAVAVYAYVAVISLMLTAAVGTAAADARPDVVVGAAMFYLSDLAVARARFVRPGFWNASWGLPLYYGAQLVLALGAGHA